MSNRKSKPTKNKKSTKVARPSNALAVFGGSMSVARNPARERNVTRRRQFLVSIFNTKSSANVLSTSQSPFPVGSQYLSNHLTFNANDLSSEATAWIRQHDRYKIETCELFVTSTSKNRDNNVGALTTMPIHHYSFCDLDSSTSQTGGVTEWNQVQTRNNLSRTVLRSNNPSILVAKFSPKPIFDPSTSNSPSNVVPTRGLWIDSLTLDQEHSGVRTYSATPTELDISFGFYSLSYELRVTVACQAPL